VVQQEWGQGLIRSWNSAGWIDLPQRVGDKIAPPGRRRRRANWWWPTHLVNLFKVLSAALAMQRPTPRERRA
jgi:kynureninase